MSKYSIGGPLDEHTPDVCREANGTRVCPYNDDWHPPHKTAEGEVNCRCTIAMREDRSAVSNRTFRVLYGAQL